MNYPRDPNEMDLRRADPLMQDPLAEPNRTRSATNCAPRKAPSAWSLPYLPLCCSSCSVS